MNRKLQEERAKAQELLSFANEQHGRTFNLSDLKTDKTQYFDSPQNYSQRSPFKSSEISARSTMACKNAFNGKFTDADFDEIMRTSTSASVRTSYRESVGANRFSFIPRTADMSLSSSINSYAPSQRPSHAQDFWDAAKVSVNSFNGKNISVASDNFVSPERVEEILKKDEKAQETEYAPIPRVQKTNSNETNWEDRQSSMRQPEMSFGQYCQDHLGNNIRDIYGNSSPKKRLARGPLVEMSNIESPRESSIRHGLKDLQKLIKNCDTPQQQEVLNKYGKNFNWIHDNTAKAADVDNAISGISQMINLMDFSKVAETNVKDNKKLRAEKENDIVPIHNANRLHPDDQLQRSRNAIPGRGLKRRSSSVCNETPRSALDKCMRSKSPTMMEELHAVAATQLKPNLPSGAIFKVPKPTTVSKADSNTLGSSPSTSTKIHHQESSLTNLSPSSREYFTATSMNSPGEKLSLPNYALVRPEHTLTSPSSSLRSGKNNSQDFSQDGQLKRTVSQLSNGSEFQEDYLPIKIKKSSQKLSWESVKLYKSVSKTISIQNKCNKKLPLRVKVQGAGFSVTPAEDFRMIPNEARTFEVRFMPTNVGPVRGKLIFELICNSKCFIAVPLFAYGGHTSIRIEGVQKGPIGPAFVTMGHVKALNRALEQQVTLRNQGTLPGFASLVFEKTKWSDFSLSNSLSLNPSQVRLEPGESAEINIRFRATKEEIRKILTLDKEVTIVGEICIITGDEPTRVRLLNNRDNLPAQFLTHIPSIMPNDLGIKRELVCFAESLDRTKLSTLMQQLKTHEIALTVGRNLDETQISAAELSMADDTNISFETFCDSNRTVQNTIYMGDDTEYYESKFFRVSPALIIFSRQCDQPNVSKIIEIQSTHTQDLYAESVSSRSDLIAANKSCGVIKPGEVFEIKVFAKTKAFQSRICESAVVSVLIGNAKVDIPVKFVE